MSDFLVLNFDCPTSPSLSLAGNPDQKTAGWGFGWYREGSSASSRIQGTGSLDLETLAKLFIKVPIFGRLFLALS